MGDLVMVSGLLFQVGMCWLRLGRGQLDYMELDGMLQSWTTVYAAPNCGLTSTLRIGAFWAPTP